MDTKTRERIIILYWSFDDVRSKHLRYLKQCNLVSDWLIAGVYSDKYLNSIEKFPNLDYETRWDIAAELVDEVFAFDDSDGTVTQLLRAVKVCYPGAEIVYTSEKDMKNTPESKIKGIKFFQLKQEQ